MILTAIPREQLDEVLDRFMANLEDPFSCAVFRRIRATSAVRAVGAAAERHRRAALSLARSLGMAVHADGVECAFNWDGRALNGATEAYVILHEAAHFALAPSVRSFGALLAAHGFFASAEDVFQLTHYELEAAIIDLMNAWSSGSAPRGPAHWPPIVAERRAAISEWAKHDTPPALGPVPDVIDDPAIVMLWGITRESLDNWLSAGAATDSNEVRGFAASSGVVEGIARIVKSVEEISRLQQGDILVCQVTNPTWAPIFQKIRAAVSDIGGSMSHAAIVAREYGLPAVVGTGNATSRIKDGQRIRVDGGRGIVTMLQ